MYDRHGLQTILGIGLKLTAAEQCEGPVLPLAIMGADREIPAAPYFDSMQGQPSNAYVEYGKVTPHW